MRPPALGNAKNDSRSSGSTLAANCCRGWSSPAGKRCVVAVGSGLAQSPISSANTLATPVTITTYSSRPRNTADQPWIASRDLVSRCGRRIMSASPAEEVDADHRQLQQCDDRGDAIRSEEHTSELQSLMRISYAVFCLKKKIK